MQYADLISEFRDLGYEVSRSYVSGLNGFIVCEAKALLLNTVSMAR